MTNISFGKSHMTTNKTIECFGKSTCGNSYAFILEISPAGKDRGPQQTSRRRWRAEIKVVIRIKDETTQLFEMASRRNI